MSLPVSKVAKMFGISRSTLLYYDGVGLLKPSGRSRAGYRLYDEKDVEKLEKIMLFREAGVPLNEMDTLISATEFDAAALLLKRLNALNREIQSMKRQQDTIMRILRSSRLPAYQKHMDNNLWFSILQSAGVTHENAEEWHKTFERQSPEQHHNFLSLLGFTEEEIVKIRNCYREA